MPHPALAPASVAVITGGASGIGLAAATAFARLQMEVCIADIGTFHLSPWMRGRTTKRFG